MYINVIFCDHAERHRLGILPWGKCGQLSNQEMMICYCVINKYRCLFTSLPDEDHLWLKLFQLAPQQIRLGEKCPSVCLLLLYFYVLLILKWLYWLRILPLLESLWIALVRFWLLHTDFQPNYCNRSPFNSVTGLCDLRISLCTNNVSNVRWSTFRKCGLKKKKWNWNENKFNCLTHVMIY